MQSGTVQRRMDMGIDMRGMAGDGSYTRTAIIVALLYLVFWIPGLVANITYYREAIRAEDRCGHKLPGTGWLSVMLWLGTLIPAVVVVFFAGLKVAFPSPKQVHMPAVTKVVSKKKAEDLKAERAAYLKKVELQDLCFSRSVLAGPALAGKVINRGGKTLKRVEITIKGLDVDGNKIFTRKCYAIDYSIWKQPECPALKPGESRKFGVAIENAPPNWAHAMRVKVTDVVFMK